MALLNVNGVQWDLLDEQGDHPQAGADASVRLEFPTRWRVFGPLGRDSTQVSFDGGQYPAAEPKALPDANELAKIGEQLTVGDKTLTGKDVESVDGLLHFDNIFGERELGDGQQVYAMAELDVPSETEVIFGAGADWWMQWWIDGKTVFENLATGNGPFMVEPSNNSLRCRLSKGKHVLAVLVISGSSTTWLMKAGFVTARDEVFGQRKTNRWNFFDNPDEILPPEAKLPQLHKAFATERVLLEETIECEYQNKADNGHVGIVFAAQDSDHYYWAYVPHWGQLWRARAVYAALGIADGSGYIRHLDMKLMPNVPCQYNVWKTLRVERRGSHIQMWINGVKGPSAVDDTYGPGRVGVSGYNPCAVRNLKIDGKETSASAWPKALPRKYNFTEPFAGDGDYVWHSVSNMFKLASGQVLMTSSKIVPNSLFMTQLGERHYQIHLSDDAGRTWANHGEAILDTHIGTLGRWVEISPGVLRAIHYHDAPSANELSNRTFSQGSGFYYRDSSDLGRTWSDWTPSRFDDPAGELAGPNRSASSANEVTVLRDGSFVIPMLRNTHRAELENQGQGTWPTMWVFQPFACRSTDQGLTWSQPVPMDNAALQDGYPPDSPVADFTETPIAELPSGRIIAMSRPCASPFMWQTYSADGGRTWQQACYASFSSAGNPQLVATQSGYLVLIARCSGVGMHVSSDGGTNWSPGAMLDSPNCYNGLAIEVEPDVILNVYPNIDVIPRHLRVQRLRVTAVGPAPVD